MDRIRHHMTAATVALLLGISVSTGNAIADETAGQKIERIAHKTGSGLRKGVEWAGNGIKKGASKGGQGLDKGMKHAAKGIEKGAIKTGAALKKVGDKLQQSAR